MRIKIIQNTQGDQCWYKNRIGEIFEAQHHHVLGMQFMDMGDFNVGKQDGTGKECLVAKEDCEMVRPAKIELEYANGDYNADLTIDADEDGILLDEFGKTIPWEWINEMREFYGK